ncbi:MAG: BsuPI-related putative proteinase inhibitor, partial [Gemmatimonadaceae bacterium]
MRNTIGLGVIALAAAAFTACSNESTAPSNASNDAAFAADQFTRLADSVSRSGGDADISGAYSAIAAAVRGSGRVSPITLTIDGVPTAFVATAMSMEMTYQSTCASNPLCGPVPPLRNRSLIAWGKDNPKRVVQLSSAVDSDPIAAMLYPSLLAIYAPMASLIYMDGSGGTYFGTSGVQQMSAAKSATTCGAGRDSAVASRLASTCLLADFTIAFDGKLEPSPFLVANNTAKGTHTIAMSSQKVAGTHTQLTIPACDSTCTPGGVKPPEAPTPPVVVRPSYVMPAALTATVDSVVTLKLTFKNPSPEPIKVTFSSGQKYDFVVIDSTTGRDVWRWSANKSFLQALSEQ